MKKQAKPELFGVWQVSEVGDIESKDGFIITSDRLQESDWWGFLFANGYNLHDFVLAYFRACQIAKIENVNIKIF